MGKLKGKQNEVMGKLSAIQTLLERYPTLTTTDPLLTNFSLNTSVGFILSLLELLGVTKADMIRWLCKLLSPSDGKSEGLLDTIEFAIKAILLLNVKQIFTCAINPNIPDHLMKYAVQDGRPDPFDILLSPDKVQGIEIDIASIDMFGILKNCPSNRDGSVFYFDAADPIIEKTHEVSGKTIVDFYQPNYGPNDLWKSKDFNAFLWFIINKGSLGTKEQFTKNIWDDRIKASKTYEHYPKLKDAYFNAPSTASTPTMTIVDEDKHSVSKKQYLICQYIEEDKASKVSNKLRVWINADRYYKTRKLTIGSKQININRTLFEFNYDYIYSLKLFDTKTLIANIANSLLELSASVSASFSFQQQVIAKKVEDIVKKMIKEDDVNQDECYFTFSDDSYQTLIDEVTETYTGRYTDSSTSYNPAYEKTFDCLRSIDSDAEKHVDSYTSIGKTIEAIENNSADNRSVQTSASFRIGLGFIEDFINQTVTQIVLSVLTPKVAVLFAINSKVMGGDALDMKQWVDFIKNFQNVIVAIVRQVKDIVVRALYDYLMEQLKPILQLLISKLLMETVKYYKDLIYDLIINCIPRINLNLGGTNTIIDNVQYADIVENKTEKPSKTC